MTATRPAEAEATLTRERVTAWRLRRHHLVERAPASAMLDVVADLAGLHAQVMSSAELTLWARVDGIDPDAVRRALWDDRTLVKTWAMRGTLHLLPARDYPRWQAALSTYKHYLKPGWFRGFGITRDEFEQLMDAVRAALEDRELTRAELAAQVAERTGLAELGAKLNDSWGAYLKPASFRGHLIFAPGDGQKVRFTRPDTWLAEWRDEDPEEAELSVARAFLAASGPVTREDFGRWWAISPAAAERLCKRLGEEAVRVEVDGTAAWALRAHVGDIATTVPVSTVRLLPAFDQYVITATKHVTELLPGPFADRVYRPQGWLSPVLLVDGRMDGIWRSEVKGRTISVEIEPFTKLSAATRDAAEAEAERLAAWKDRTLDLRWLPVA
jgi:hypothetical protein